MFKTKSVPMSMSEITEALELFRRLSPEAQRKAIARMEQMLAEHEATPSSPTATESRQPA